MGEECAQRCSGCSACGAGAPQSIEEQYANAQKSFDAELEMLREQMPENAFRKLLNPYGVRRKADLWLYKKKADFIRSLHLSKDEKDAFDSGKIKYVGYETEIEGTKYIQPVLTMSGEECGGLYAYFSEYFVDVEKGDAYLPKEAVRHYS